VAATLIAMVWSYFLNCGLTFQIRPSRNTFLLFPLSNVANLVITTVGIRLAVEQLGVHERLAPLTVALVAIPITFIVTRYLLVGPPEPGKCADAGAPDTAGAHRTA
jgi:putative flippase GtrA